MGDDATSAESGLFSPRRSRNLQRSKNRSRRTNSFVSHLGSVALVISPTESTAHTENCRTSERSPALGECPPISTGWCFCRPDGTETKRGAKVGRRCFFERVGSVFASLESTPSSGKNKHRRGRCADGAFRQQPNYVSPRELTCAGGQKATFANQLRGVGALAESP